uniref:Uncharacterized protein n=1 Tax=Chromera velia CCMP2878 TaxID=1169474 RepID=A0A0G4F6I5_9ALVE|eukprot:Cvel_15338.t1-p1 / transcript=Cvel_15338.t1 / gene=Cvel_15338 / organism=Chromera_velia_CCMP2878 / gene_product=hypothetical protein / transcript_product=hypothetical protein / location=Cvel_scaffold1128:41550-42966(-) / protein_length=176 / sequence_SO=supercontig / SO=protein_coding / is_pseudo=false
MERGAILVPSKDLGQAIVESTHSQGDWEGVEEAYLFLRDSLKAHGGLGEAGRALSGGSGGYGLQVHRCLIQTLARLWRRTVRALLCQADIRVPLKRICIQGQGKRAVVGLSEAAAKRLLLWRLTVGGQRLSVSEAGTSATSIAATAKRSSVVCICGDLSFEVRSPMVSLAEGRKIT